MIICTPRTGPLARTVGRGLRRCIAVVCLALAPLACQHAPAIPSGVVFINERELSELISVYKTGQGFTDTGTFRAWVTIMNETSERQMVEARVVFVGENGAPIEEPTGWRQIFIEPNATATYEGLSMTDLARGMEIQIREGNRR